MTDQELAKEIITEIRREHRQPVLRFTLEPGEPVLAASKVGGTPYLPRETAWPLDGAGGPLGLLAQVDCGELAGLPDFPHSGLLQFFFAYEDIHGVNFDDITDETGFRVLYHETVDPSVTAEEVEARRPPLRDGVDLTYETPLGKTPCRIRFAAPAEQGMTEGDYRFEGLFVGKWNARCPEAPIERLWDIDLTDVLDYGGAPFHQMGGYPCFTQTDPRWNGTYPDLDTLLFQLDTQMAEKPGGEDLVMWGDCGIGNFFISREALKRRDFSRVGYNWDCG